jgi:hypothetical protein
MVRTFTVSDVEVAPDVLPGIEPRSAIEALAQTPVEAWWRPSRPLAEIGNETVAFEGKTPRRVVVPFHPFVAAVHAAFDQHRPLVLSPDAVWLCIAQGLATHVNLNAEKLRRHIVAHDGRETIAVRRDQFRKGAPDNDWPGVFGELSAEVARRTGELHGLVVADFSTTDATSRAVSELALLSLASPYFVYQVHSMCGIPSVTLTGTVDDWRAIERRAAALAHLDTGWWLDALLPFLAELTAAADGRPDVALWRSFYKMKDASGGPYISGWINVLLPYVLDYQKQLVRNGAVAAWREGLDAVFGGGPTVEQLTSGLSRVPFLWKYLRDEHRMEMLGGFAGVAQDPATRAVSAELGWAVADERPTARQ